MSDYNDRREDRRQRWEERQRRWEERRERWMERRGGQFGVVNRNGRSHIWTGLFLLLIGAAALLKATFTDIPSWAFGWQSFLILLGFFIGIKHRFRGAGWFILMLIGGVFLIRDMYPELHYSRYLWPVAIIILGFYLIVRPRHHYYHDDWDEKKNAGTSVPPVNDQQSWSQDDFIDATSIFGGAKKNILSKDFKGGDIVNIFGGTELNLSQADIKGRVPLEMTTIFGGTKLIIPPNWVVKSEAVTIFGGLEDKRPVQASPESADKILVLKGTVIFGGIEIKSY